MHRTLEAGPGNIASAGNAGFLVPATANSGSGGGASAFPDTTGIVDPSGAYGIQTNDAKQSNVYSPFGPDTTSGRVPNAKPTSRSLRYGIDTTVGGNIWYPSSAEKGRNDYRPFRRTERVGGLLGAGGVLSKVLFSGNDAGTAITDAIGGVVSPTGIGGTGGGGIGIPGDGINYPAGRNSGLGAYSPSGSGITIGGDSGGLQKYWYTQDEALAMGTGGAIQPHNPDAPLNYGGGPDYAGNNIQHDAMKMWQAFGQVYGDPTSGYEQPRPFQRTLEAWDTGSALEGAAVGLAIGAIVIAPFIWTSLGRRVAKKQAGRAYGAARRRVERYG